MPKMMRAVQVSKPNGAFELVERELPEPDSGQIRIKVEACGVCHSDVIVRGGAFPGLKLPRIPGHEIAGRVEKVGAGVTEWQKGDRGGDGWHGADKAELVRQLGAHEYIDTQKVPAAEGLQKLGGADLVLATAPNSEAIASTVEGLKPRGKLLIVAAPFEPLKVSALTLLSGK